MRSLLIFSLLLGLQFSGPTVQAGTVLEDIANAATLGGYDKKKKQREAEARRKLEAQQSAQRAELAAKKEQEKQKQIADLTSLINQKIATKNDLKKALDEVSGLIEIIENTINASQQTAGKAESAKNLSVETQSAFGKLVSVQPASDEQSVPTLETWNNTLNQLDELAKLEGLQVNELFEAALSHLDSYEQILVGINFNGIEALLDETLILEDTNAQALMQKYATLAGHEFQQ